MSQLYGASIFFCSKLKALTWAKAASHMVTQYSYFVVLELKFWLVEVAAKIDGIENQSRVMLRQLEELQSEVFL